MEKDGKDIYNDRETSLAASYARVYEDLCREAVNGAVSLFDNPHYAEYRRISDDIISFRLESEGYDVISPYIWEASSDAPELICRGFMERSGYRFDAEEGRYIKN